MHKNTYSVYILASKKRGTLYVGITSDLIGRVYEHKQKIVKSFTSKYDVTKLVYYEDFTDIYDALYREKKLKRWNRQWKIVLIEEINPHWNDLYEVYVDTKR